MLEVSNTPKSPFQYPSLAFVIKSLSSRIFVFPSCKLFATLPLCVFSFYTSIIAPTLRGTVPSCWQGASQEWDTEQEPCLHRAWMWSWASGLAVPVLAAALAMPMPPHSQSPTAPHCHPAPVSPMLWLPATVLDPVWHMAERAEVVTTE